MTVKAQKGDKIIMGFYDPNTDTEKLKGFVSGRKYKVEESDSMVIYIENNKNKLVRFKRNDPCIQDAE